MLMIPMAVLIAAVMIVIKAISTPWPRQIKMREEDADRNANETQEALGLGGRGRLLLSVPECKHVRQSADGNAIRPLIRPHFGFSPGFIFNSCTINTHRLIFQVHGTTS